MPDDKKKARIGFDGEDLAFLVFVMDFMRGGVMDTGDRLALMRQRFQKALDDHFPGQTHYDDHE